MKPEKRSSEDTALQESLKQAMPLEKVSDWTNYASTSKAESHAKVVDPTIHRLEKQSVVKSGMIESRKNILSEKVYLRLDIFN